MRRALMLMLATFPLLAATCEYRSAPYFEELDARLAQGTQPQVGYLESMHARQLMMDGDLQDVSGLVDRDDFFPITVDAFTVPSGELAGIPRDVQTIALVFNGPLLDELGLEAPQTWDDLAVVSRAVADGTGGETAGLALTGEPWNWLPFLYQAGGALVVDNTATLNTAEAERALSFYVELVQSGAAIAPEEALEPSDATFPYEAHRRSMELLEDREVAMVLAPNHSFQEAYESHPDDVRAAPLPTGPAGRATIAYVRGLAAYSPITDESRQFMLDATGEDAQRLWFDTQQFMPTRRSLVGEYLDRHPAAEPFVRSIEDAVSWQPDTARFDDLEQFDRQARAPVAAALRGELTAGEALQELQSLAVEFLAR